jgi:hypothetical protein
MRRTFLSIVVVTCVFSTASLMAQQHQHPAGEQERLGTVHFETSCAAQVAPTFDRAVALLHSFEFGASIAAFEQVLASDSTCAMAWWGIALGRWLNPMTPNIRPAPLLQRGRQAAEAGARIATRATSRERAYLAAVAKLYADHERLDQRARLLAYESAMSQLSAAYPDDPEARIFHALSLAASALPTDKTYANQLRAGAMLEEMFVKQPNHPGLAHYIIHSYDYPALADRAAAAAAKYADIAPSAAHALHMPSHTFTRVGMWRESVKTNQRSKEEAMRTGAISEALHAMDYAVYANLQMRRDSAVRALLREIPGLAARFDPDAVTGAAPGSAGVFALAAMPARYALERDAWSAAAALPAASTRFPYAEAMTYLARSIGATRIGDLDAAQAAADSLRAIHERLLVAREAYWAESVAIQHLSASAWLALARGQADSAEALMRQAAMREDATEKAAVTPGPLAPAREQLADLYLERKRYRDALTEYRASLKREPNRYRSLRGAMRSAAALGDSVTEAQYRQQLALLTGSPN